MGSRLKVFTKDRKSPHIVRLRLRQQVDSYVTGLTFFRLEPSYNLLGPAKLEMFRLAWSQADFGYDEDRQRRSLCSPRQSF
jgi:hypothetical protein